jgi:hypothetical protein
MKMQLISDSQGKPIAVQIPIHEFIRLKNSAGEAIDASLQSPPEKKLVSDQVAHEEKDTDQIDKTISAARFRRSATVEEVLGRNPDVRHYFYTKIIDSWTGPPKKGQRTPGTSSSTSSKQGAFASSKPFKRKKKRRRKRGR